MNEFEGDLEAAGRLFKAVKKHKGPKKKRRLKKSKTDDSGKVRTDAIVAEMKGLGLGTSHLDIAYRPVGSSEYVVVENYRVFPLVKELRWTAELPQYEQARQSAIDAMMHVHAQTQSLQCSFNAESPHIEETLFQIRAGLIPWDDPRIVQLVNYAQKIGKGRTIHRRIDDALHDAERRKQTGETLPDLNKFRLTLAVFWSSFLFWLMSDDNIAAFMHSHKMVPPSFACNPSSITKARNELGLVKSDRLLVKSVGPNFVWKFVQGYPPEN